MRRRKKKIVLPLVGGLLALAAAGVAVGIILTNKADDSTKDLDYYVDKAAKELSRQPQKVDGELAGGKERCGPFDCYTKTNDDCYYEPGGRSVTSSTNLTNTGSTAHTFEVTIGVGLDEEVKIVSLSPGETTRVSATFDSAYFTGCGGGANSVRVLN